MQLTERQAQCAKYVLQGKTAREIAVVLGLSKRTVEDYISHIKLKLGCQNKAELIISIYALFNKKNRDYSELNNDNTG